MICNFLSETTGEDRKLLIGINASTHHEPGLIKIQNEGGAPWGMGFFAAFMANHILSLKRIFILRFLFF